MPQFQRQPQQAQTRRLTTADEAAYSHRLKFPIQDNFGDTISELHFRRPKGKDLRALHKDLDEMTLAARLIVSLSGISDEFFDELDAEDVFDMTPAVVDLLPSIGTESDVKYPNGVPVDPTNICQGS